MQAAFVVAIALTGLGVQNKSNDLSDVPPVYSSSDEPVHSAIDSAITNPYPRYTTPSSYSGYYQRSYGDDVSDVYPTHWDALHATLYSFVWGHDPDVPTVAEIEASVYGDYSAH
jgi:hypothetical protein